MTEAEVRGLCLKSREIFLSQPILLELEAPLKICGMNMSFRQLTSAGIRRTYSHGISGLRGRSRISGKGVKMYMYKGVGVRFAAYI